jgi:hypothetical protein
MKVNYPANKKNTHKDFSDHIHNTKKLKSLHQPGLVAPQTLQITITAENIPPTITKKISSKLTI